MISDLQLVPGESSGDCILQRGIHEFLNPFIFEKLHNVFFSEFYAVHSFHLSEMATTA